MSNVDEKSSGSKIAGVSHDAVVRFVTITNLGGATGRVSITTLPDYVLLEIFNFFVGAAYREDEWHTLVHVCQKWRSVAFASPRRLDLRLLCSEGRLAKETLEVWPALLIIVKDYYAEN